MWAPAASITTETMSYKSDFIALCLELEVLRFDPVRRFQLKSGRSSPYFFNAGLINTGAAIAALGRAYAAAIAQAPFAFDMLFGPAYKGIALVTAAACALAEHHGRNLPFAFNRKEAKNHGEGGDIIGSPLKGRVLIVDDVITAGTAIRESVELIRRNGAQLRASCWRSIVRSAARMNRFRVPRCRRSRQNSRCRASASSLSTT